MVTGRTFAVLGLSLVNLLLALGSGFPLYFYVFILTVLVLVASFLWSFWNLRGVRATTERAYVRLQVGEEMESRVTLRNNNAVPKFGLEVLDLQELPGHNSGAVVNLQSGGEAELSMRIPLRKRGIYTVRQPTVYSTDPFGVFRLARREPGEEQLVVFPYMVDIPPISLSRGEVSGEGDMQRNAPTSSSSVSTIREYQQGESYRHIHWPSTARRGELMLKQFDAGLEDTAWVVLDLQRRVHVGEELENTEEYAITAAASMAKAYSSMGWAVGLVAQGDQHYVLPPREGLLALERMLTVLTEARAFGDISLRDLLISWQAQAAGVTSLVVVTPSLETDWVPVLEAMGQRGIPTTAVLVDPGSFGAQGDPSTLISQLQRSGISTHPLRRDEDVAQALRNPRRPSVNVLAAEEAVEALR